MLTFLLAITDEEAHDRIRDIFKRHHELMLDYAKSKLQNYRVADIEHDAEDAVQNAFMKIVKYIDALDKEVSPKGERAYMMSIVSNEVINIIKAYRYFEDIDECENKYADAFAEDKIIEQLSIKDKCAVAMETIKKMDEKYSVTMLYYYQNEFSVEEIADLMGISVQTVYTRLRRGRILLLESLGDMNV